MKPLTVHLVCNAHIDPIWMWTWKEGLREAISTFQTAADLLDEYPEFIFNHNESLLYEWVEEYDPQLFVRIQAHVKAGRWNIAGGWYLQPDLNIAGGESIVRQMLEGRTYFASKFGARPTVAYNFDCFGHPAGLPQLLKQAGFEMYIHCRPLEQQLDLPGALYRWRGSDGSEIIAIRPLTGFYLTRTGEAQEKARAGVELARKLGRDVLVLWGLGDHGGGATREDLEKFRTLMAEFSNSDVILRHSTPEDFLEAIRPLSDTLPVHCGELQRINSGTYTTLAPFKRALRESEALLSSAEKESAIAWWRFGREYPAEALRSIWKMLLFNTFHDTLSGTILEEAVPEVMDIYGIVRDSARRMMIKAQNVLIPAVAPKENTIPIYVFNPHASRMRASIGLNILSDHSPMPDWRPLALYDDQGQPVVHQQQGGVQLLQASHWQPYIGFIANVPALACRRYEIRFEESHAQAENPLDIVEDEHGIRIINHWWQTWFDRQTAALTEMVAQSSGVSHLKGPVQLFAMQDGMDAWGGENRVVFNLPLGPFTAMTPLEVGEFCGLEGQAGPALRVINRGPVSVTVESLVIWQHTRAALQMTFFADMPEIEINIRLNMAARCKMIKLLLPFALPDPQVVAETPYSQAVWVADGTEFPCGRWLQISGTDFSVGVCNNGQSGFDVSSQGDVGLSLSRGAAHIGWENGPALDPAKSYTWIDQTQIDTRFRIIASTDAEQVAAALIPAALELNQPLERFFAFHLPAVPDSAPAIAQPFLRVEPGTVVLGALKKADAQDALVIRLVETIGKKTEVEVQLEGYAPRTFSMEPHQVKTWLVARCGGALTWKSVNLLEEDFG